MQSFMQYLLEYLCIISANEIDIMPQTLNLIYIRISKSRSCFTLSLPSYKLQSTIMKSVIWNIQLCIPLYIATMFFSAIYSV